MLQFALAGLTALLIVGLAVSIASRRVGQREATLDARSESLVKGQALVEPVLTDGILARRSSAVAALDDVVREQVLDDTLVRVKVWRADGTILYSDESRLIGSRYDLGDEEREAMRDAKVEAEVSDLQRPENRFERAQGKLLEVYLPLRTPDGTVVLFEAYFRYETVSASGSRIWRSFAPVTLGSLIVLELVQIPLAWSLARRLRQRQLEREDLLNRALTSSERERRRIAQDLHDGVVQDLAGVSYALAAASRRDGAATAAELESAGETVRSSIEALRTLLVEIYPPDLAQEGLGPALADLVGRSRATGLAVELDTSGLVDQVPEAPAGLAYRTVQEALRNVVSHAAASSVLVRATSASGSLEVVVTDDGRGFDATVAPGTEGGHLGLAGLAGLALDAGAELTVTSEPGTGTTIRLTAPIGARS
ncbi:ATP-binding protein [Aquihabitans sp. G128]|uniref:sensor histidine kinase n=1 Tax=Aquihabitans sp. G128 TaxID=2849779 RepID=UPI001C2447D2|nr:histidine kinase [Aquihabitans sp. G128]QXC62375.1 ATP-binding protein [Aquihabitans sp. G128]